MVEYVVCILPIDQDGILLLLARAGHHVIKSLWILHRIFIEFKLRQLYASTM